MKFRITCRLAHPENWVGLLITISFHAACAALLRSTWPPPSVAPNAPAPARFVYWMEPPSGPGPDTWDADPRALRSPVLFALPTSAGFSPPPRRHAETIPAFQGSGSGNLMLERLPLVMDAQSFLARNALDIRRTLDQRWTDLQVEADPFDLPPGTGGVFVVEWPDGAPEWVAGVPPALQPPPAAGERAWEASAWVQVSEAGDVSSVFLSQPTPDRERNDSLVRALRTLRAAPGREGRYRANLYFLPAADRAAGAAP